jgi:hypothetical protein
MSKRVVNGRAACCRPPASLAWRVPGEDLRWLQSADISAWIALFLGLYALAAGIGELRSPNSWSTMLKEFERSPALRFVTGLVAALALGATIYLANPWRPTTGWRSASARSAAWRWPRAC